DALRTLVVAESSIRDAWPDAAIQFAEIDYSKINVLRLMGRVPEARDLAVKVKEVFREWGMTKRLADAIYSEALLHYAGGNFTAARVALEHVVDAMRFAGDQASEACTYFTIGRCWFGEGDEEKAIAFWAKAAVLYERCRMPAEKVRIGG